MNKPCVLLTGIGGFIGQNVAEYLTDCGIDVIGFYYKKLPNYKIKKNFSCDLSKDDFEQYLKAETIDAIIHFAGQMRGDKICNYLDNTIGSSRKLIDYAERTKVNTFIYISSISVYGETISQVNENSDMINPNDYGITKYLCERLLEDSHINRRIVIRLPRTLGKGCDLSYPWLPKVTDQLLKNEDVYYTNPELLYNNILHVDDLSKFLLHLLLEKTTGFERFVLGAKDRKRIIDILYCLRNCLSSHSELIEKPVQGRNKCYAIDTTHAQQCGFDSRSIDEIIEKFVENISKSVEGESIS